MIDEAHHNFHTVSGRYRPFAKLLGADGYRVVASRARLDSVSLSQGRVLVIANALDERNEQIANWRLPALSAFQPDEIAAVASWVRRGGSLLLIADHMPFAGAASDLAEALGIHFANGFALWGEVDPRTGDYPIVYARSNGTLLDHAITRGRTSAERIDSLESFTGSALWVGGTRPGAIMALPRKTRVMLPVVAWQFSDSTARLSGDGLLQGAAIRFGSGRVAVFGEAAMFSAQRKGVDGIPMGMNAPSASQNPQFILNVLHWLTGLIK